MRNGNFAFIKKEDGTVEFNVNDMKLNEATVELVCLSLLLAEQQGIIKDNTLTISDLLSQMKSSIGINPESSIKSKRFDLK